MTTETILTDEQVGDLYQDWYCFFKDNPGSAALCIRAIEQAVLQSPEVQTWKKDASLASEYRELLEGAAAVLENCADDMEDEGDEIGAHEARSMANVINAAMEKQP